MKAITQEFKDNVKLFGRQLDSIITYELNGETIELGNEDLNSVSPHYEGGILKSVMKQLDIDSNVDIPLETVVTYRFGVKVRDDDVEDYRENYDYIDFGNYVVYKSEKQEDTNSYKLTCYDKLLYSMKEYENLGITYPISVREYINTICTYLGLTFANIGDTFANYDKLIPNELYMSYNSDKQQWESLGYTFRDVLDELAEVTASTICINDNDELEIRYITDTGDTIDEEYLKDINVNFGESYGPVNTIVLSRSAGVDNIYFPEILPENPIELKISDNQIMNNNNRDTFMPDIYNKLNGLTYYINDFSSTGITYYDLCDKYNVQIGENIYSCIMFNNDIQITQGLQENIYTDLPEESVTDYTKADSTDRRINQTYLIVDKQNQAIEGIVSNISEQNEQIATIRLQYNELLSRISDIADITTSAESTEASVPLSDVNASQPINIKIHPIGENISYLYPNYGIYPTTEYYPAKEGLKPSNLLTPSNSLVPSTGYQEQNIKYPKSRILRFTNTDTDEVFDWVLPADLWYYDASTYDELELSYGDGTNSSVIVTRKCKINNDSTISPLATPTTETYPYPTNFADGSDFVLTDGNYTISLVDNTQGYLFVQLMAKNIYTTQFYTKAETNSYVQQTARDINIGVDTKLSNYSTTKEMNTAITIRAGEITNSVSETYATKTTTNQLSTRIGQTAKGISLTVNNGSTSSGITIGITKENGTTETTSGTIQMNGLVKFSDLSGTGTTTINGANITTGTISANRVSGGTLSGTTISGNTINGGTINIGSNFSVNNQGVLNASSANISGKLTAGSGSTLGGWTATDTKIYAGDSSTRVAVMQRPTSATTWVFAAGGTSHDNYGNCPFRVSKAGALYSTSGTIGGWTISGSSLSGGTGSSSVEITPGGVNTPIASAPWSAIATSASDERVKNSIEDIDEKYEEFFDNLKPKTYKYNEGIGIDDYDKLRFGFVAQDILEYEDANDFAMIWGDKIYQLDKREIIALNTWQIQKLKKQVHEQETIIEDLQNRLEKLERESDK